MLGRINILDDPKFPCQLLASASSFHCEFVIKQIDFVMVFRYFIGDTYCKTSVVN